MGGNDGVKARRVVTPSPPGPPPSLLLSSPTSSTHHNTTPKHNHNHENHEQTGLPRRVAPWLPLHQDSGGPHARDARQAGGRGGGHPHDAGGRRPGALDARAGMWVGCWVAGCVVWVVEGSRGWSSSSRRRKALVACLLFGGEKKQGIPRITTPTLIHPSNKSKPPTNPTTGGALLRG